MLRKLSLERIDGLDEGLAGILDLAGRGLAGLEGCDDIGADLGQGAVLLQVGDLELGRPAAHDGEVGEAEVLEFPEKADLGVAPSSEVAEERIRAAAQPAPRVGEEHARDERAKPRLLPPDEGRLDLVPVRWPARGGSAGPG